MKDMSPSFKRLWIAGLVFLALVLGFCAYVAVTTENWFVLALGGGMVATFSSLLTILASQHTTTNKKRRLATEGEADAAG